MTRFHLIRHAEPKWELAEERGLLGAQIDFCPLTETGIKQAEELAAKLSLTEVDIVISSPYTRALLTAAILSRDLRLPLTVEYDLHEWVPNIGRDYTWHDLVGTIMVEFKKTLNNPAITDAQRSWESPFSVRQRVEKVLRRYLSFDRVIVVTHGVVISCLIPESRLRYCDMVELNIESTSQS